MQLTIRYVGNDTRFDKEISNYQKRLSDPFSIVAIAAPHSKQKTITKQIAEEAKNLNKGLNSHSLRIATAISGKNYSSEALFNLVSKHQKCTIFIGGCNGLDNSIVENCDVVWSLSALTLPHALVRLIVAEQWYRLNCIYNNHPYHK